MFAAKTTSGLGERHALLRMHPAVGLSDAETHPRRSRTQTEGKKALQMSDLKEAVHNERKIASLKREKCLKRIL
jgi:hypothetical protein